MATFPKSESEIVMLGQTMTIGLVNNVAIYPAPPVTTAV